MNTTTSWNKIVDIHARTDNANDFGIVLNNSGGDTNIENGDVIDVKNVMYIDLTLGFGAGNEPTSVDDWRIQDIINKGYIATNTTGTQAEQITRVLCDLNMKIQVK